MARIPVAAKRRCQASGTGAKWHYEWPTHAICIAVAVASDVWVGCVRAETCSTAVHEKSSKTRNVPARRTSELHDRSKGTRLVASVAAAVGVRKVVVVTVDELHTNASRAACVSFITDTFSWHTS